MRFELAYPMTASELSFAAEATCPIDRERVISAITTDSRLVRSGDLFIALRGQAQDGHHYIEDAKRLGAALIIAEAEGIGTACVTDTGRALGNIAAHSLRKNRIPVVAITGSVGKTGAKDAVAAALGARMHVHKTADNQNNDFGVSYTILSRRREDEIMVLEFGTNNKGEILHHAKIAPPDIAIITAIGSAHIGAFGSKEAILAEKSDIYHEMRDGLLLLNGDDVYLKRLTPTIRTRYVGMNTECDLRADKTFFSRYGISYTLIEGGKEQRIFLRGAGIPRIYASLFAIAAAEHFGIRKELAIGALYRMPETEGRQHILSVGGILLIDDAYNASPEAMSEALRLLSSLPATGRRYAVLGDMLELGDLSEALHRGVGMEAAKSADRLYCFGRYASAVADGAKIAGMPSEAIRITDDAEACLSMLKPCLSDGDTVLVKASHALGGERIVSGIRALDTRS